MADECCDVSRIVTTFLLNTCRLPPRLRRRDIEGARHCAELAGERADIHDIEAEVIPLTTGSVAEFYIKPMLPLVGDIDVMYHYNNEMATPQGHPPPTQLPAEFHNYVQVVNIVDDSDTPGYVYLQVRYLLTQCIDDGKYSYFEYDEVFYEHDQLDAHGLGIMQAPFMSNSNYANNVNIRDKGVIRGPALTTDNSHTTCLSVDAVRCVRCLVWPTQAADWPTRHRNYGWPDSAIVDRVVSNGCDVVRVAHPRYKEHELIGRFQHRLSFSRAEIVLINSWMPVQQIVYHLLRYFIKTQRLTDCADNSGAGTLSNYHVKTLMLWACELKPRSWWTEDINLVRICVELLQTLSVWLTDTRCPHYFVYNCNLLDNSLNVKNVANKLMSIDEECLSVWFINNYVRQCAQLCPVDILRLFDDVSSSVKLQNAVSEIVCWRVNTSLRDLYRTIHFEEYFISLRVSEKSVNIRSYKCWMNQVKKIDKRFSEYFLGFALLHVARKISRNGFSDDDTVTLLTLLGRNFNLHKTELNTSELVELLQKSAIEYLTTYRQVVARDFCSVATIVTTDFEALYAYKRGDYQRCLQLSTQNVHMLLYALRMPDVSTFPEFIQVLDDDIVSLTALMQIINPECRLLNSRNVCITQLTLSLYLMTQCQLKLHHSVTSLAQTLDYITVAIKKQPPGFTLDQLTLKLIERKVYQRLKFTARKVV